MIVRNLSAICQSVPSGSRDRRSPINIDRIAMMSGRCIEEVSSFVFLHMSKRLSRLHLSGHPGSGARACPSCGLRPLWSRPPPDSYGNLANASGPESRLKFVFPYRFTFSNRALERMNQSAIAVRWIDYLLILREWHDDNMRRIL